MESSDVPEALMAVRTARQKEGQEWRQRRTGSFFLLWKGDKNPHGIGGA